MNKDRGIIKWQPFNSVISSQKVLESLILEKQKQTKPILSEEETMAIEEKIIEAYYAEEVVTISYYQNGYIKNIKGQIKKIDYIMKIIYLNNLKLLFKQILTIY